MKILTPIVATLALFLNGASAKQPNVLFIIVDDLKPELSAFGGDVFTPAIDSLAASGTTFLNAHCQQAVCGPSRASLMTGLRPDTTQVWDTQANLRAVVPDLVTLPQYFKEHGYTSIGMGKVFTGSNVDKGMDTASWSYPYTKNWQIAKHYNEDHGHPANGYQGDDIRKVEKEAKAEGITHWRELNKYMADKGAKPAVESSDVPDNAYFDGAMTQYALGLLDELSQEEQPFFLTVGFSKPHLPFVAPKKYWDMIDADKIELASYQEKPVNGPDFSWDHWPELRAYSGIPEEGPLTADMQRELIHGYYACAAYIDAQIAKLLGKIEALGLENDTIIVLLSDHGWHLGDHGQWSKHTNYEQATHVPLIIVSPGISGGKETTQPVGLIDVYPTVCQLAGLSIPSQLDGLSLVPFMQVPDSTTRKYVMSQYPRWNKVGYAMRTLRFRFIAWYETDNVDRSANGTQDPLQIELYDYAEDPLETRNLAEDPEYQETVKALQAEMNQYLKQDNNS